jgi:hypothetical protein
VLFGTKVVVANGAKRPELVRKWRRKKSKNNLPTENMDGTEYNGTIKIKAMRRTYAGVRRVVENKNIKLG